MSVDVVFTKREGVMRVVVLLKDEEGNSVDGSVAIVFHGDDAERIFLPAVHGVCFDPVYPSLGDDYVSRLEKGVYYASGSFSFPILRLVVFVKCPGFTLSKELAVA